ncbi:MAG: sugar ABC transporter permease [Firmicutes bacterium]|nr:sugar ABC transporter permease [Bacillota bacterium]
MLVFGVFVLSPIVFVLLLSFHKWSVLETIRIFIGLDNYCELFHDLRFWNAVWNTARYTLGTVPLTIIISLGLALAVNSKIRGRIFFRGVYFLPAISSMAIVAIIWAFLLDPDIGIVSYYMRLLGVKTYGWLRSPIWAMPAVIGVGIWKNIGFYMVIFLAGLQSIPDTYYEAAKIDGAGTWQQFKNVTLPLLMPTTMFVVIISIIASFQVFDQVYVMTRGGPLYSTETLVQYIYYHGFETFKMGYASSVACVWFIIILIFTAMQLKYFNARITYY